MAYPAIVLNYSVKDIWNDIIIIRIMIIYMKSVGQYLLGLAQRYLLVAQSCERAPTRQRASRMANG